MVADGVDAGGMGFSTGTVAVVAVEIVRRDGLYEATEKDKERQGWVDVKCGHPE